MVVLPVHPQVLREVIDAARKKRNLNLSGTGVRVVQLVILDDFCSDLLGEHYGRSGPFLYCFRFVTERGYQTPLLPATSAVFQACLALQLALKIAACL